MLKFAIGWIYFHWIRLSFSALCIRLDAWYFRRSVMSMSHPTHKSIELKPNSFSLIYFVYYSKSRVLLWKNVVFLKNAVSLLQWKQSKPNNPYYVSVFFKRLNSVRMWCKTYILPLKSQYVTLSYHIFKNKHNHTQSN